METNILIAFLSLLGTAIGSVAGILTANRLVVYRIEQLEAKVNKHNNMVERVFRLEADIAHLKKGV